MKSFKLSANLIGHQSDVKSVYPGPNGGVITGSRDQKAIVFTRDPVEPKAFISSAVINHTGFVNAVAFIPASQFAPEGYVVSAGRANVILVHTPSQPFTPAYVLSGHTDNVCALAISGTREAPLIISGSWDKTARVWSQGHCIQVLNGHTQTVWGVLGLEDGRILTASADKTIKLWANGVCVQTFVGHTDCVRGLALFKSIGFVSCGNDGSVRIWSMNGSCIQELYGHTAFVYSVDVLETGEIVSSGEDRTVRIWKDGQCNQVINIPAISVWAVKGLPNGDIVVGSNDGVARIFTRSEERIADESLIKLFEEAVSNSAIPKNQLGDLNTEKLPGEESLRVPGKNTGDVKVIKNSLGKVEAYQWSAEAQNWEKIGDVVDSVGDQRKTTYEGKDYDYVFSVDLEDGSPPRKLPYNVTENPYTAAQNFIHREELSQGFLDQIANFIIQNTKGATLGSGPVASDPFTGTSRYSGSGSSSRGPQFGTGDPFTGGSAYTTQGILPMEVTPSPSSGYYPKRNYIFFEDAKLATIRDKIIEFNAQLPSGQLNLTEIDELRKIVTALEQTNRSTTFEQSSFEVITKILAWPAEFRFPGLDLFRVLLLRSQAAEFFCVRGKSFIDLVLDSGCFSQRDSASKPIQNDQLLGLRVLSNLFKYPTGRKLIFESRQKIFDEILFSSSIDRAPLRVAVTTFFVNIAVLLNETRDDELAIQIIAHLVELLRTEKEIDVCFRSLVAIGTTIFSHPAAKDLFLVLEGKGAVEKFTSHSETKLSDASRGILILL